MLLVTVYNFFLQQLSWPSCFYFRPVTRIGKKKKLKINIHRPAGTRVVFDEEGSTLPPLATIADMSGGGSPVMDKEKGQHFSCSVSRQVMKRKQNSKYTAVLKKKKRDGGV